MPAIGTGLIDDIDILQNERVIDMDDAIAMLDPDVSQFTTMLMRVARSGADSTKVEWLEDELFPRLATVVSGGATDGATITLGAGEGDYFRVHDLFRNARTGVAAKVDVATSSTVIDPGLALGRVAFVAHAAADQLLIIGNAAAQGATLGTRKVTKRVAQLNYQQIFRSPYGFTRSLMASKLYGGPEPAKERKKKAVEHKRGIEYTLFWGVKSLDVSGSEPRGQAGGLFEFVTSKVIDNNGALSKTQLDTAMRSFLQNGENNQVFFVSPLVAQAISGFLRDAWNPTTTGQRLWGAKVDGFISGAYGYQIPVVVKRDWNDFSSASKMYGGWGFSVNMDAVSLSTLRSTSLLRDRQANDADSYDEEYLTEFSVKIKHERKHGILLGVTG
jgi:Family of unknown function (DUF5309)